MSKKLGALTIDEKKNRFQIDKSGGGLMGSDKWFDFSDLISYKVRTDNQRDRVGGSFRILGTRTSGSTTKLVTHSMDILVTLDNLNTPTVSIQIIKKPLSGKAFDKAIKYKDDTVAGLYYILRHK